MVEIIQLTWFLCLLVLMIYHILIFRLSRNKLLPETKAEIQGVSVIIAVKNGTQQISQNLSEILHQEYPSFELIIVDDHSDPVERKELEEFISDWPRVKLLTSEGKGKKNALWTGILNSKFDFILCTDADCTPVSRNWINSMVQCSHGRDTVIGYSPYQKLTGWLNYIIRFETVMTGIQYLSWTMKGKPYMAVGRNILYPKSLLIANDPFSHIRDIPYGDDDLGIQAISDKSEIRVCLDEKSFVISDPTTSWTQWLKQKHRHMSAGHYYKPGLWWQPGLYGIALIGHWSLIVFIIGSLTWWNWIPVFAIGLLIRWFNYIQWTQKLGAKDTVAVYPLLEIIYTVYLAVMGTLTIVAKKQTWN